MAGVVNQQVGVRLKAASVEDQGRHDLVPRGITQKLGSETVTLLKELLYGDGVVDRGLERLDMRVVIVSDHQSIILG